MTPQLERLAETGPSDEIRDRLNESSAGMWRIVWWGRFEDLRRGRTDGSREVLEAFREVDDDEKTGPITDEELEAFIEYARAWRT
jgi:hypothetical protein